MLAGTVCYASYKEVTMYGIARLVVSDIQRFFGYLNVVHCGLCAQKPAGVGETQFLLSVAKRLRANVRAQFGFHDRHSMTAWSGKLTFVPLLGKCEQWGPLRDARVGVFRVFFEQFFQPLRVRGAAVQGELLPQAQLVAALGRGKNATARSGHTRC